MSWKYIQANGNLVFAGELVATGYSGFEQGRNNPALEKSPDLGPIPIGRYVIGPHYDSEKHGPVVMRLFPSRDTDTFGRGSFLIHGDAVRHPGLASHGCIILDRPTRLRIAGSEDRELEVV